MHKQSCKLDNVQLPNASGIDGSNICKSSLSHLFQNSLLLHILTFLVACFCTCSSLNFLLRWIRGEVLCSVRWQPCTLFIARLLYPGAVGSRSCISLVADGIFYLVIHSGPSVTVWYGWNPTSESNKSFLLCCSIHIPLWGRFILFLLLKFSVLRVFLYGSCVEEDLYISYVWLQDF